MRGPDTYNESLFTTVKLEDCVPAKHPLVGQTLEARLTARGVELLMKGNWIASHARSARRGGFTAIDDHMPAAHRAHRDWTPQRLIECGQRIGLATGEVVTRILEQNKHPEHGYRACLGLLGLGERAKVWGQHPRSRDAGLHPPSDPSFREGKR